MGQRPDHYAERQKYGHFFCLTGTQVKLTDIELGCGGGSTDGLSFSPAGAYRYFLGRAEGEARQWSTINPVGGPRPPHLIPTQPSPARHNFLHFYCRRCQRYRAQEVILKKFALFISVLVSIS